MRRCVGWAVALAMGLVGLGAGAQAGVKTQPIVMLSDIHFDPFHDPAKFAALVKAPVAAWAGILSTADSAGQAEAFAALQTACTVRGVDTPIALLTSSLKAERAVVARPLFVTVSGDLMAHRFDCKYEAMAKQVGMPLDAAAYSAFAAKTVAFVALRLRETFPGVPVYVALGNNDSGCRDYDEDAGSAFLQADAKSVAAGARSAGNAAAIRREAGQLGDYSVALPMPRTRLIVLQDIFESKRYTACDGKPPGADRVGPEQAQLAWLLLQLANARTAHERVWVMAHIPPGVDAYSTLAKGRNVCKQDAPEMFLDSDALARTLAAYADVVKLVLLGHTHMDEMRAYASLPGAPAAVVPGKLVPSISPVNGNLPAFTVGEVEATTATLKDYVVYKAGDALGTTAWREEYRYSATYGEPDFSGASVQALMEEFLHDKGGAEAKSQAYASFYIVGQATGGLGAVVKTAALRAVWPAYACSMTEATAAGFQACVCGAGQ